MITDININYTLNGVKYNMPIAEGEPDENIASDLAAMFSRALFDIGAVPLIVIDEMKAYFDIEE